MKQTLIQSWKFLTSKLHQPLPLNHHESHKLLTLLNDSFKRNLDRVFPPGLADTNHSPDDHFQSFLKSPLFNVNRARPPSSRDWKMNIEQDALEVRELVFSVNQPTEYFRQQVASGAANMASAKLALNNQIAKARASNDTKASIRASEMGSIMANWLWSSGQYERVEFLKDPHFIARLLLFLVAEGQYKPIWEWLQRSQLIAATSLHAGIPLRQDIGDFIKKLVQSEVLYGQGLQSAIQMFLTILASTTHQSPAPLPYRLSQLYYRAGMYLTWSLVARSMSSAVEESVIDSFDRSIESWAHRQLAISCRSLIQLLRPQQRASVHAAQLVSTIDMWEAHLGRHTRRVLMRLSLKTIETFLANGSLKEAAQVMRTLQLRFGGELGMGGIPAADDESKDDEKAVLRSLDMLLAT
ncbi:MAG: hypothetical protein LQ348_003750 [Seirophora lacunosa]|nr:MAG: hypothetical protein LQ344_006994 [Seirophora lacunosa]KAI4189776.1 MAG: hypothetical protein LQ348_003750 [Seirophora lacunosa]